MVLHKLASGGEPRSLATQLAPLVFAHRAPIDLAVSTSTIAVLNYEATGPQLDTRPNVRAPRYSGARAGELQSIAVNVTRAANVLRWRPAVDLVQGVHRAIHWLRAVFEPEPAWLEGA